jgi:drug/metabolite transporter (DMT)-like permease
VAGALLVVYLVWGSTYLGIALALETLPPLLMASARFLVAGAILYLVASRFGDQKGDRPGRTQWAAAVLTGAPLFLVGNGGVVWAQQTVPSGIAALLIATLPLWIALLDRAVFGSRLSIRAVVGLVLGFGGLALLVAPRGSGEVDPVGSAVLAVAALGWATGSLLSRDAALPARPLVAAGMQMLAGGAFLAVAGVINGELGDVRLEEISARSAFGLVYLILFGSLIAFSAYAWLLRSARTSLVAPYAYVKPGRGGGPRLGRPRRGDHSYHPAGRRNHHRRGRADRQRACAAASTPSIHGASSSANRGSIACGSGDSR